jgi:hypothetical protein
MKRKNTSSTSKYSRETAKKKDFKTGTKPSVARSSTEKKKTQNKTKTGQAQLRTYLPSGETRTRPSTIITRVQQRRHDQQQHQRQKLKQLVLH